MAFQKTKRKSLPIKEAGVTPTADIIPISIEAMVLDFNGKKAYFKRLKYKGCPGLRKKNLKPPSNAIDMHRDAFVSDMYQLFKEFNGDAQTGSGHFKSLTHYVEALDLHDRDVDFSEENILWYLQRERSRVESGVIMLGTLMIKKNSLSAILKAMGNESLARKIPSVKRAGQATKPHPTLSDSQLTAVGKKMMVAYMAYSRLALKGEAPTICPLFDADELRNKGFSKSQISKFKSRARQRVNKGDWRNAMTRLAFMITSLWTGANTSPLAGLTRSDAVFKKTDGDHWEFDSVKARALYAEQKLGMGFTKRTKLFVENWLVVSEKLASGPNARLFPFFGNDGVLNPNSRYYERPQKQINKALVPYGYAKITTSIFRKTRSNAVMRAFNDFFVVADANNTTAETAKQSYLHGVKDTHEIQLAGAFVAQEAMAQGVDKKTALEEAASKFKDPLTELEWLKKHKVLPNKTPTGMRCEDPFGERAKQSLIPLRDFFSSDSGACVDFLECFWCEHHGLISETDDIWAMLSFRDSAMETLARPSVNSVPAPRLKKILLMVDAILIRHQEKALEKYQAAAELNKEKPHPLYDDGCAIDDLLEIYRAAK
jgi:hypothetical protein